MQFLAKSLLFRGDAPLHPFSKTWEQDWEKVQKKIYLKAA